MTAKSVLVRSQGMRPMARAPTMVVGSGSRAPLDFHTWYKYSR